jgi:SAM-dependent methyltransferase
MCILCAPSLAPAAGFSDRLVDMINSAAVVQMISVGHRTGLFDAMAGFPPSTSRQIADSIGLNERYVREWLGTMVTGRVIAHDPQAGTFWLPDDHASVLSRAASPDAMGHVAQFLPLLARVEDEIVECFRNGGGVPYERFPRFHEVMAEESGQSVVSHLLEHILPLVKGLDKRLDSGIRVLDIGCGRGEAVLRMAARFPASRFVGYDLSPEAIGHARARARELGLSNARFEVRDLTGFSEPGSYDLITAFDAIHDQKDPASVLAGIARSLRPGGVFLMQDIAGASDIAGNMDVPFSPFMYTVSCMHCMTVSLAQGGAGLGAKWGEQLALHMLGVAGFGEVELRRLEHDPMNAYFIARAA